MLYNDAIIRCILIAPGHQAKWCKWKQLIKISKNLYIATFILVVNDFSIILLFVYLHFKISCMSFSFLSTWTDSSGIPPTAVNRPMLTNLPLLSVRNFRQKRQVQLSSVVPMNGTHFTMAILIELIIQVSVSTSVTLAFIRPARVNIATIPLRQRRKKVFHLKYW